MGAGDTGQGGMLLPPAPDVCQECAVAHEPNEAHNRQSLYYQYRFRSHHGRWPTWRDAIAHTDEVTRAFWEEELRREGAWDGWEGEVPPAPDVAPTPGHVGTVTKLASRLMRETP